MLPLLTALLLAIWVFHPWAAIAEADILDQASAPTVVEPVAYSPAAAKASLRLQEARDQIESPPTPPPPTPPPVPEPTPAAPPPAPTPVPFAQLSKPEIETLVCTYSWPCEQALKVMWCESGARPWAVGRGTYYGLYQISLIHARRFPDFWNAWMDPAKNIQWAHTLWSRQGWKPWSCRPY